MHNLHTKVLYKFETVIEGIKSVISYENEVRIIGIKMVEFRISMGR